MLLRELGPVSYWEALSMLCRVPLGLTEAHDVLRYAEERGILRLDLATEVDHVWVFPIREAAVRLAS